MSATIRLNGVLLLVCAVAVPSSTAVKDEATYIADEVNGDPAGTWTADGDGNGVPGVDGNFERLMGVLPRNEYASRLAPIKEEDGYANEELPERFDARERWPECFFPLDAIKDQSNCGSCWAVSSASVFSDRLCIATGGAVAKNLSAEHLNTCCYRCGHGCDGGMPEGAWYFFARHGIVTGGDYDSGEGCQPYSIYPCGKGRNVCIDKDPDTPECTVTNCTNTNYTSDYEIDLNYVDSVYTLPNDEEAIMADIYKYGPVQAAFYVYTDFMYYKRGIYQYVRGQMEGGHAIKILGWGVENGVKYWLCANSWSRTWGENGKFRMFRGGNECGIEERVVAGLPRVPKKNKKRNVRKIGMFVGADVA